MFRVFGVLVCSALLSACSTTRVDMRYEAPNTIQKVTAAQPVTVSTFTDARKDDPNWMGAIRGGFGNSLKTLVSNQPVAVVVQNAFADGLRARGVPTSSDAKLSLSGTIQKFESITVIHRGATIAIDLDVTDVASGKKVFSKNFVTDLEEDSGAAGVFASIDDLRKLVERGLRETVDKALDDPEVRHALKM